MGNKEEYFLTHKPEFQYLSEEQKEKIHHASLELLEYTGADFYYQEAIDLLADAGARVVSDKRVKIPAFLIEAAIRSCPKHLTLANRKGERTMPLAKHTSYYGPGSETPFTLDVYTGERL